MIVISIFSRRIDYFLRLTREVGYWQFFYRYLSRIFYKSTKRDQVMTLSNKVKMVLPYESRFGTEIFIKRTKLDWGSESILMNFLDNKKTFIDVGANIGYYSLLAAPTSYQVYSFEPDSRVIKYLEKNLSQFQNCHIFQEALYSQPDTMELSLDSMSEFNSLVRHRTKDNKILVKVNTLDNLMKEDPSLNVSCIKIDAEGADFEIILGGKNLLIRDQPLVLAEAYPSLKLLKFINSIGFTCFAFAKPKDVDSSHLKPKLIRINDRPVNYRVKMIFLVPQRLLSQFEKLRGV